MMRSKYIRIAGFLLWIGVVSSGYAAFIAHGYAPPNVLPSREECPAILAPQLANVPTIFCFAHPQCPCTRATLHNLSEVATAATGKLRIVVYFYAPSDKPGAWVESDSWRLAREIPGAEVQRDIDGALARACRAAASGTVMAYAPDGTLLYAGGLTASRGHEGQNTGTDALAAIARGESPSVGSMPAFGCLIYADNH